MKQVVGAAGLFVLALASAAPAQNVRAAGDVPRTAWGDPDLEGVWDYWTFTPLERPKEYASKAMLTDAEHAELLKRLSGEAAALDERTRSSGETGAYSQEARTDRTRGIALKQTSLLIDPPDGKTRGSFRWTDVPICHRTSRRGWEIHAAGGKTTHSSSRARISHRRSRPSARASARAVLISGRANTYG